MCFLMCNSDVKAAAAFSYYVEPVVNFSLLTEHYVPFY